MLSKSYLRLGSRLIVFILCFPCFVLGKDEGMDRNPVPWKMIPSAPVRSPGEVLQTIELQEDFVLDVIAHEPAVLNPVALKYDGNGRAWVCEMVNFMPDVDANGEEDPTGRISILEDSDSDGVFDRHGVFLDKLVLPRALAFVPGGILFADQQQLYYVEVLPGLRSGRMEVVDPNYSLGGNVEHKPNGLLLHYDGWLYSAKCDKRYKVLRFEEALPHGSTEIYRNKSFRIVRGKTHARGQWGISMDDQGRLYTNRNSTAPMGEMMRPNAIDGNPAYKTTVSKESIGGPEIFSIRVNPGINRGYREGMLNEEYKLARFTAASGTLVYRGTNYPERFYGMVMASEPAANLLSARHLIETDGSPEGMAVYKKAEILASADERFRPVNLYSAPDGTVTIVDMYHGILQHKTYVTPYLERQIAHRNLGRAEDNLTTGRLYRLRWRGGRLEFIPKMEEMNARDIVPYLAHANGWHRDSARRLILTKGDKSMGPIIESMILQGGHEAAMINMLWTLKGLGAVSLNAVQAGMASRHEHVVMTAMEVGRYLPNAFMLSFEHMLRAKMRTGFTNKQLLQLAISAGSVPGEAGLRFCKDIDREYGDRRNVRDCLVSGLARRENEMLTYLADPTAKLTVLLNKVGIEDDLSNVKKLSKKEEKLYEAGKKNYFGKANCFSCHGYEGEGVKGLAPALAGTTWVTGDTDRLISVILRGLMGPIHVKGECFDLPVIMPGHSFLDDEEVASVASYIRNAWGNEASVVKVSNVEEVRKKTKSHPGPFTANEL